MAFYVNQLTRGSDSKDYMVPLELEPSWILSKDPFGGDQEDAFRDFALQIKKPEGTELQPMFEKGETYYLRFSVRKIPQYFYSADNSLYRYNENYAQADILNLSVLLQKERENITNALSSSDPTEELDQEEKYGNIQKIGTCTVPMKPYEQYERDEETGEIIIDERGEVKTKKVINSDYSSFTFIFTPRSDKQFIGFKILRTTYDAIQKDNEDHQNRGRTWLLDQFYNNTAIPGQEEKPDFKEVIIGYNGITPITQTLFIPKENRRIIYNDSFDQALNFNGECSQLVEIKQDNFDWAKIGYQGRPGSLIVVNQEPIRVGRSGIFELNSGLKIKSFKLAAPNGAKNVENIDAFLLDYAYIK